MNMITLTAFICFCALQQNLVNGVHVAIEIPALQLAQDVCKVKSGVSDEVFAAALNNHMDANDRNLQCYTKCMFEQMHAMDSEGKVNLQPIIDQLGQENKNDYAHNMLTCQSEVDDPDKCVKGMKLYQCFQEKSGSKFYFV